MRLTATAASTTILGLTVSLFTANPATAHQQVAEHREAAIAKDQRWIPETTPEGAQRMRSTKPRVGLRLTDRDGRVKARKKVRFTGFVRHAANRQVQLQRRVGRKPSRQGFTPARQARFKWRTVRRVDHNGRFAIRQQVGKGRQVFRARVKTPDGHVHSRAIAVRGVDAPGAVGIGGMAKTLLGGLISGVTKSAGSSLFGWALGALGLAGTDSDPDKSALNAVKQQLSDVEKTLTELQTGLQELEASITQLDCDALNADNNPALARIDLLASQYNAFLKAETTNLPTLQTWAKNVLTPTGDDKPLAEDLDEIYHNLTGAAAANGSIKACIIAAAKSKPVGQFGDAAFYNTVLPYVSYYYGYLAKGVALVVEAQHFTAVQQLGTAASGFWLRRTQRAPATLPKLDQPPPQPALRQPARYPKPGRRSWTCSGKVAHRCRTPHCSSMAIPGCSGCETWHSSILDPARFR